MQSKLAPPAFTLNNHGTALHWPFFLKIDCPSRIPQGQLHLRTSRIPQGQPAVKPFAHPDGTALPASSSEPYLL
ncbi:hypothetical protein [Paenibacillus borealis]|uniref:hypothetical protein n=1 Tax=Paenibacillus borealis TaxID=160799 RepID=UPI000A4C47C7|nr:hypothetical protein [Paenibacillus borealis]